LLVLRGLIAFVVVAMLLAGVFTLALPKEPRSEDVFIEDFTMQPKSTGGFSRIGCWAARRAATSFARVGVATA
jgi:hypothetical protein